MSFLPRASRYLITSISMFALDLLLVFLFTQFIGVHYIASVVIGFVLTTALLSLLNRAWAFKKDVHLARGLYAVLVALTTLGIVTGSTYLLVEWFGIYYLVARLIAAIFGFAWSYVWDSLLTFDIAPFH